METVTEKAFDDIRSFYGVTNEHHVAASAVVISASANAAVLFILSGTIYMLGLTCVELLF